MPYFLDPGSNMWVDENGFMVDPNTMYGSGAATAPASTPAPAPAPAPSAGWTVDPGSGALVNADGFSQSSVAIQNVLAQNPSWTPGAPMPVADFQQWQNGAALNPDGTIQGTTGQVNPATGMVDYKLQDDSLLGSFLEFAEIPAMFGGAILGAGALNGLLSGVGAAGSAAGEIAALTGSGVPVGGALGTGATASSGLGSLLENFTGGGSGSGGGSGGTSGFYDGPMSLDGAGVFNDPFKLGNLESIVRPGSSALGNLGNSGGTGTNNDIIEEVGNFTGSAGAPGAAAGAGTALSRIIDGTATTADWMSILGTAGSSLLGMVGSNQQADSLRDIANQARADRQPFLNKSLEWLNDPAAYAAGPGKAGLDATLRALSVQGNPFGSPTNLAIAGDIANKNWQNAVTGFGNIGLSGQDSRNQALTGAVQADSNGLNALGYGLENIFNPRPQNNSLNNMLRQFGLV